MIPAPDDGREEAERSDESGGRDRERRPRQLAETLHPPQERPEVSEPEREAEKRSPARAYAADEPEERRHRHPRRRSWPGARPAPPRGTNPPPSPRNSRRFLRRRRGLRCLPYRPRFAVGGFYSRGQRLPGNGETAVFPARPNA